MIKTDYFLSVYKELETELRDNNTTVLDYEPTLPPDEADKLKITRQMRNYIQHHSDGETFLSISPSMLKFIQNEVAKVKTMKDKVKDRVKRLKACIETDKLEDVCKWMSKNKKDYAPITDKDGNYLGVITAGNLIAALTVLSIKKKVRDLGMLSTKKKVRGSGEFSVITTAPPSDNLDKYNVGQEIIVVDNGKYKGIVKW